MGLTIGIDLGTTTASAAAVRDDAVVFVEDDRGRRSLPAVVHFAADGSVVVGHEARAAAARDPEHVVHSARRLLGRRASASEARIARGAYLYGVTEGPLGWPEIDVRGGPFTAPEVCACVLRELRSRAERFFGEPVERAVVAVPAGADDAQREQTRAAGRVAGLGAPRLLAEPLAAALACARVSTLGPRVMVYDLGGGTLDCSVVDLTGTEPRILATSGDAFLGGDDVDLALAEHVARVLRRRAGVEARGRAAQWKRLLAACEEAKVALAELERTKVELRGEARPEGAGRDVAVVVDRALLDRLASPLVERSFEIAAEALRLAGLGWDRVDDLLLVGGSSRLSLVRHVAARVLGRAPLVPPQGPEAAVAAGAALEAARAAGGLGGGEP